MATTPVYTTKAAIFIGVAVTLVVGVTIGSTLVANMVDSNRLQEYQDNPKIKSLAVLNDDINGHAVGWNPGMAPNGNHIYDFTIIDSEVTENSIVYATFVVSHQFLWDYDGLSTQEPVEAACFTNPADGSFMAHCAIQENNAPREGSALKYIVITPS